MRIAILYFFIISVFQSNSQINWNQKGSDISTLINNTSCTDLSDDGNTLIIGTPMMESFGDEYGMVEVYNWDGNSWQQKGASLIGNTLGCRYGTAVSISGDGNTIAIGQPVCSWPNSSYDGLVEVHRWNGSAWLLMGIFHGDNWDDRAGRSVSLSFDGNTLAYGAPSFDNGYVKIYSWSGSSWNLKGQPLVSYSSEQFGFSVSISNDGNKIAVGAPEYSTNNNEGRVAYYFWDGLNWSNIGGVQGLYSERMGSTVVISGDGNTVAMGGDGNNILRLYNYNSSSAMGLIQKGIDIEGTSTIVNDEVDLNYDGSRIVVAFSSPNPVKVLVFEWEGGEWIQFGSDVNIGFYPYSVSINALGDIICVSNPDSGENKTKVFEACYPITYTDQISSCNSYTWIDGNTYTTSTDSPTYTYIGGASNGCDSTIYLDLNILNSSFATDIQSACDSYTWIDGNTYTESINSATYTLSNVVGCDSVITLNLTINSNSSTDFRSACDSYTWIDGITYTSNNNSATHVLTNTAGCDSVVTLNLTLFNSNQTFDEHVACDVFTWIDGNTYTQSTNAPFVILENQNGCDSTVFLELTINESTESFDVNQACGAFTWIDGNVYTEDNYNASVLLQSSNGCDSIVNLNLTFVNEFNTIDEQLACESYTWINGTTYYQSTNSESLILSSEYGCDSIVTLNLEIGYPEDTTLYISSFGEYHWNGITYTESGTYEQVLQNQYGCDSTVILNLNIDDSGVEGLSEYGISVYPNPFSSIVHLDFENLQNDSKFILTDIHGKVIGERNELKSENVLLLQNLNCGVYYLVLYNGKIPISRFKLIKKF